MNVNNVKMGVPRAFLRGFVQNVKGISEFYLTANAKMAIILIRIRRNKINAKYANLDVNLVKINTNVHNVKLLKMDQWNYRIVGVFKDIIWIFRGSNVRNA